MADFSMTISQTFSPNTVIASSPVNTILQTDIRDKYNTAFHASTGHTHDGTTGNGAPTVLQNASPDIVRELGFSSSFMQFHDGTAARTVVTETGTQTLTNKTITSPTISNPTFSGTISGDFQVEFLAAPPVGSIVAFWPSSLALTFDTDFWAYANGQTISNGASPLDGVTLPDLSERYLVGFGTEGGGDNDSATFSATPVGNSGHTVNVSHSHTVNSHSHTVNSHTHSFVASGTTGSSGSHSHTSGTLVANVGWEENGPWRLGRDKSGSTFNSDSGGASKDGDVSVGATITSQSSNTYTCSTISGSTGTQSSHTHSFSDSGTSGSATPGTSSSSPSTNSQLSSSLSIQPRSILVRWIMRIV